MVTELITEGPLKGWSVLLPGRGRPGGNPGVSKKRRMRRPSNGEYMRHLEILKYLRGKRK